MSVSARWLVACATALWLLVAPLPAAEPERALFPKVEPLPETRAPLNALFANVEDLWENWRTGACGRSFAHGRIDVVGCIPMQIRCGIRLVAASVPLAGRMNLCHLDGPPTKGHRGCSVTSPDESRSKVPLARRRMS